MSENKMDNEVFLVAYDGKDKSAIDRAAQLARKQGASLLIVHVLEWSPYTFLTPEELAERHRHRQEELEKATSAVLEPALVYARGLGVKADGRVRHGNVVDTVCEIAAEENAGLIVCGRSDKFSTRVFGSVASGLAQTAPVAVVIVP